MYDLVPRRESSTVATRNIGIGYSSTDDPAREQFFELRRRARLGLIGLLEGEPTSFPAVIQASLPGRSQAAPICEDEVRLCRACKNPLDPGEKSRVRIHIECQQARKAQVAREYRAKIKAAKEAK